MHIKINASDIYSLYRPSKCEKRVFLRAHGETESKPSEFDELIRVLGERHELEHLLQFEKYCDLSRGELHYRARATIRAVMDGTPVIYQGVFISRVPSKDVEVIGIPDFLIKEGESHTIRDCKLSRNVDDSHHQEILLQLELYGWLFENIFKKKPQKLEVYLGDKSLKEFSYTGGKAALQEIDRIISLSTRNDEPYSPVGWSKCSACVFRERCWKIAVDSKDVALVYELDQSTAFALRENSVSTINELVNKYDVDSLSELKRQHGKKMIKVGKRAERILQQANSLLTNEELILMKPNLPIYDNYVMFDLEGMPPQFDELDKVYLWGTQVYGEFTSDYMPALADFEEEGDRKGWMNFLNNCESIFREYGDIPFIHWASYETTKIKSYINRYGDRNNVAQRVLDNCVDLLTITKDSIVLPEYSYSLKVIEKRVGFKRSQDEYGGEWSMVQYIKAIETKNEDLRNQIMSKILKYNEEDLKATWEVFLWLKEKSKSESGLKIFLDDQREAPEGWQLVRSAKEAIELLKSGKVSKISLDHDLGDDVSGTGYDVLLWIERAVVNDGFIPPKIIIHTANVSAGIKMELAVKKILNLSKRITESSRKHQD